MTTIAYPSHPRAASRPRGALATAVIVVGPLAAVVGALLATVTGLAVALPAWMYLWAAVLLFSPLPLSLPAVLMDTERDATLAHWTGPARIARAALLLPVMLFAPTSTVRGLTACWLASWAASIALVISTTH